MARKRQSKKSNTQNNKARTPSHARVNTRKWQISDWIGLASVLIAVVALFSSMWQRFDERNNDQIKNANQAFVLNTISSDFKLVNEDIGREIASTFHNASPNPVFDVVLVTPTPLGPIETNATHYHQVGFGKGGTLNIPFPTLPPGEKIEYIKTYSQDLFQNINVREFLNKNFYFCFTDVDAQRWLAHHRGASRIDNSNTCYLDASE